jgi:hypothetical protein
MKKAAILERLRWESRGKEKSSKSAMNKRARSRFAFLLIPLFPILMVSHSFAAEEERPSDRLVILYTGEAHGNVEPCG